MGRVFKNCLGRLSVAVFLGLGFTVVQTQAQSSCSTETFQVPVTSAAKPVDVLLVLETSSSMSDVRPKILEGLKSFIASLPVNSDFNFAVMLSHGGLSPLAGKLYQASGEPLVLKTSELTREQIQASLETKILQAPSDSTSGGGEEGIFSLYRGVTTPELVAESQGAGFFRDTAALSVVFIADRRDICAYPPAGVPEESDPVKQSARIRDCEGVSTLGLLNRLAFLKGSLPVLVSGLLYAKEPVPLGKELGYGYLEMISQNRGFAVDLAQDDLRAGMNPVAALGGQTPGQSEFILAKTSIDPLSLKVSANGQDIPFRFDGINKVTTLVPVPEGGTASISYCLKVENPYTGLCAIYEQAEDWEHWTLTPATQDLVLKNKKGNNAIGAVRNLLIDTVNGKLTVQSAMAVASISSTQGNSYLRITGDIGFINSTGGSMRIDKAAHVGAITDTNGSFQLNAQTVASYTQSSGNACVRAESIGKIESMNGNKTFIANEIAELSAVKGTVHIYGAVIHSLVNTTGKVCLHNGAKVINSTNVRGFVGECPVEGP